MAKILSPHAVKYTRIIRQSWRILTMFCIEISHKLYLLSAISLVNIGRPIGREKIIRYSLKSLEFSLNNGTKLTEFLHVIIEYENANR